MIDDRACPGEHGEHGIAFGPDGALYLACGNESAIRAPTSWGLSLRSVLDGGATADVHGDALSDAYDVSARPARVVDPNTARGRPGSTGLTGARVEIQERGAGGPARGR